MPAPKVRILFADDDLDNRELTRLLLTVEGFEVVGGESALEVLRLAREVSFDLVLLDNRMPDMSGLELCRKIREFDPHTPIVFYSAAAYDSDKKSAFECGAQGYVVKPVGGKELAETLRSVIAARAHLN